MRVVVMGVSGCGKSSVGADLSDLLGIPYCDGDDLHSAENVTKMAAGIPLTDADRWTWLDRVGDVLAGKAPVIVGCSALQRSYRDRIRVGAGGEVSYVYLAGTRDQIAARMALRDGHYMPLSLLDSQFAALEIPGTAEAMTFDICLPAGELAHRIAMRLCGRSD